MPQSLNPADRKCLSRSSGTRWSQGCEVALVFLVFALYAGWPVPEPNEPHYLGKAKHYWSPAWIERDFFLDSADAHWTFYVVVGWASRWLSLPALAWTGRAVSWALLAWSWRRLSWSIVPRPGAAILSAALLVALNENFHMAGEWVVGGFEAKPLAYALVFAALAELVHGRWNATWILLGAASALHLLVGGWATVAAGMCWLAAPSDRPTLTRMLPGLAIGALLSLPGLIPALALTVGAEPAVVARANEIYVYERLRHHLSFLGLPMRFQVRFALLAVVWGLLSRFLGADSGRRRLRGVINVSLLLVGVGIGISIGGEFRPGPAAGLLRFYWFRLADVFVPLGVALGATSMAFQRGAARPRWRLAALWALSATAAVLLAPQIVARFNHPVPRADKPGKVKNHDDWRAACEWVAAHAPADARFLTPRSAQTFKWYAGRSEVVTWKDMPQDAKSIVAWRRRLEDVYGTGDPEKPWYDSLADIDLVRLIATGAKYDAGHVLTESEPRLSLPILYSNDTYAVYELPQPEK